MSCARCTPLNVFVYVFLHVFHRTDGPTYFTFVCGHCVRSAGDRARVETPPLIHSLLYCDICHRWCLMACLAPHCLAWLGWTSSLSRLTPSCAAYTVSSILRGTLYVSLDLCVSIHLSAQAVAMLSFPWHHWQLLYMLALA